MEIVYLPSAAAGLSWFRRYYTQVFPEGEKRAIAQYEKMKKVLLAAPYAGHPVGEHDSREYVVPRTPFSVIYRVRGEQIQILLILDHRAARPQAQ
jgi:plasmid stabilization system protein ParE